MFGFGKTKKYSAKWFSSISDEEFYSEREPVREKARDNGGDSETEKFSPQTHEKRTIPIQKTITALPRVQSLPRKTP